MSDHGSNRITLRKIINELDLDLTSINENRKKDNAQNLSKTRKETPLEEILVENSTYKGNRLLNRLVKAGYKEAKCEQCGITEWNQK